MGLFLFLKEVRLDHSVIHHEVYVLKIFGRLKKPSEIPERDET